jgi:hypothetical protein
MGSRWAMRSASPINVTIRMEDIAAATLRETCTVV